MNKSKRIFLFLFVLFMIAIFYFIYDFSKRTTFPGKKKSQTESAAIGY